VSGHAGEGGSGKETALRRCSSCRACIDACPTGAIHEDRFLISAEKCYTLHSESHHPMPAGIGQPASLCIIGCLACQEICPENKHRLTYEASGVDFTAEETEAILAAGRALASGERAAAVGKDPSLGPAWTSARAKFARLGMTEDLAIVGRNLGLGRKPRN
jgi:ferredoxin